MCNVDLHLVISWHSSKCQTCLPTTTTTTTTNTTTRTKCPTIVARSSIDTNDTKCNHIIDTRHSTNPRKGAPVVVCPPPPVWSWEEGAGWSYVPPPPPQSSKRGWGNPRAQSGDCTAGAAENYPLWPRSSRPGLYELVDFAMSKQSQLLWVGTSCDAVPKCDFDCVSHLLWLCGARSQCQRGGPAAEEEAAHATGPKFVSQRLDFQKQTVCQYLGMTCPSCGPSKPPALRRQKRLPPAVGRRWGSKPYRADRKAAAEAMQLPPRDPCKGQGHQLPGSLMRTCLPCLPESLAGQRCAGPCFVVLDCMQSHLQSFQAVPVHGDVEFTWQTNLEAAPAESSWKHQRRLSGRKETLWKAGQVFACGQNCSISLQGTCAHKPSWSS